MIEIYNGERGGKYKLSRNKNRIYISLIANRFLHYSDRKSSQLEECENENSVLSGLTNEDDYFDWDNTKSKIENSVDLHSLLNCMDFQEQEKDVLEYLKRGFGQNQIAIAMDLSKSRISQIVNKLGRKLWIRMERGSGYEYNQETAKVELHRCLEKLPTDNKVRVKSFRQEAKEDIKRFGNNSVYNLILFGFPEKKAGYIADTFAACRKVLDGKNLTKKTLYDLNVFDLERNNDFSKKSIDLIKKLNMVITFEKIKKPID